MGNFGAAQSEVQRATHHGISSAHRRTDLTQRGDELFELVGLAGVN
jgi:hypothetical protein